MQFSLWTLESGVISIIAVIMAGVIGFLISRSSHGKLQSQLQQAQQSIEPLQEQIIEKKIALQKLEQEHQTSLQQLSRLDEQRNSAQQLTARLEQELQSMRRELQQSSANNQQLTTELAELKTHLANKEQNFKEQLANLQQAKQVLSQEFENIANKVFEEKNKAFTQTSQTSIDQLLKPFREQIDAFQKRSNDVHDASLKSQVQLESEIKKVLEIGIKMGEDAKNLATALKGDSQQRGAWGEAQLERTLQISGLIKNDHYQAQTSFVDEQGRNKRTDYIIKLPDGKHLIIDSKVTLNAYSRVVEAESTEDYNRAMKEHCEAVRRHIDDLKGKDYTALTGIRSPDYVLMFMPIEAAYIEALKYDSDLFEYGYHRDVILVSHTTLIPILRTVANLWRLDNSTKEAQDLSQRAGDIYKQVSVVAERLDSMGKSLQAVGNHYNNTVTALAGRQGLYGKVEQFKKHSSNVALIELEPKHLELDNQRLNMVIEPIAEEDEQGEQD